MTKHVVARADELPVGGHLITVVDRRSIGVFNVDGRLYAIRNVCPHQGAELCRGRVVGPPLRSPAPGVFIQEDGSPWLQCPWHGWEFDLITGRSWFDPTKTRVSAYSVAVENRRPDGGNDATAREGPFEAETYEVGIETDYIVVTI